MIQFIVVLLFTLQVSAFQITQITEIEGQVIYLECDSDFNCYAVGWIGEDEFAGDFTLYKLDQNKTVVLQINFTMVYQLVKNSQDNIYLFARDTADSIWRLEPNSNELKLLYRYPTNGGNFITRFSGFIIDEEDNMLFNSNKGIVMLKPNLNTPIAVKNLESCSFDTNRITVDREGNIYFSIYCDSTSAFDSGIVVITSAAKHQQVPYATVVEELVEEYIRPNTSYVYQIVTDSHNNVIFINSHLSRITGKSDKVDVKIIRDGAVELILSEYNIEVLYGSVYVAKDRTYFIANMPLNDISSMNHYLYFIDSNGKINKVDMYFYIDPYGFYYFQSDRNGDLFFVRDRALFWIKHNETEVRKLFETPVYGINWFYADSSDVMWVQVYDYYYSIPLESGVATKIESGTYAGSGHYFLENSRTREIYLGNERGLFVLNPEG